MIQPASLNMDDIKALRANYAKRLPGKIREVEAIWNTAVRNPAHPTALKELNRLLHNLVGSSGTFGFSGVSHTARSLRELIVSTALHAGAPPGHDQNIQARALITLMKKAAAKPNQGGDANLLWVNCEAIEPQNDNTLVYIVEDDSQQAEFLATQVRHFGYDVKTFGCIETTRRAVKQHLPMAIIMDMILPEGRTAGAEGVAEINRGLEMPIPVLFISVRDDFESRLAAVRAGGNAYFTKPIDVGQLINHLDFLTSRRTPEPYRILIVDDDPALARVFASTLSQAGMLTLTVTDPTLAIGHMNEFGPDLILLDVQMPGCTGPELATIIRQQSDYVGLPIVYLSSENEIQKQLAARSVGADDFLTKPVEPARLTAEVSLRAHRARILRSHLVRDSHTGLYNHSTIMAHLAHDVARAQREHRTLSFAILDIDRFKRVNDTHGHMTGDRVLKTLARILRKRLRKSDIIGRYGGDEFVAILPDADGTNAAQVMDEIRENFSKVPHTIGEEEIYATFSCGVSSFPNFPDANTLSEEADRALYTAKHHGGNAIVLAEKSGPDPRS